MKRNEQITNAIVPYQAKMLEQGYDIIAACNRSCGFYDGALWADANPVIMWHKYPEEKPKKEDEYLVCYENGYVTKNYFYIAEDEEDCNEWKYCRNAVIAWMELPQPPKFD